MLHKISVEIYDQSEFEKDPRSYRRGANEALRLLKKEVDRLLHKYPEYTAKGVLEILEELTK